MVTFVVVLSLGGLVALAIAAALTARKFGHVVRRDGRVEVRFANWFAVSTRASALALFLLGALMLVLAATALRHLLIFSSGH